MRNFLDGQFLLYSQTAINLYEQAVKNTPVFDFHCHLDPKEIWENKPFENIAQLWLGGDHYKWRVMRMHGIDEAYITGDKDDFEKFQAWAETVPNLIGNPLYHWTHLELKTYFGIEKQLNAFTAYEIYEECNKQLADPSFRPRALIERSNVAFIGTTDDPLSTLDFHRLLRDDDSFRPAVAPTFRPDGAMFIEKPDFTYWIKVLSNVSGINVDSLDGLLRALQQRIDFFHENGGRASDHDIPDMRYAAATKADAEIVFKKRLADVALTESDLAVYRSFLLKELGKMYAAKQWVMQLHIGALRNNNSQMMSRVGPDTGFDSIDESNIAKGLSGFLDALNQENALPRTVLYNLNPKDNAVIAGMMGNFTEQGIPGKIQLGSAWWFNDHIDGMEKQIKDFANVGVLSHFIGMLTDSRSFLSYPRHDYFRRILCNIIGEWMEKGLYPNDMDFASDMLTNISFDNARKYFLER